MADIDDAALDLHRRLRGKVAAAPKAELTPETLELLYTPGVGAVSRALAENPAAAWELTGIGNAVAVVSDGSAVLGLGDEGPVASLPSDTALGVGDRLRGVPRGHGLRLPRACWGRRVKTP
jgi:malic enzyme